MISSASIHWLCHQLHWTIDIREICVFLAPIFSSFTALITYLFTKELWSDRAGLFAAAFIAIAPGYASRSVAGSYDNEGIGIFAMIFTYFLWIRSMKSGSLFFSSCTALAYFYMVSEKCERRDRHPLDFSGLCVGRLRLHHQSHCYSCSHSSHFSTLFAPSLRFLFDIFRSRSNAFHANSIRSFSTCSNQ